MDKLTIKRYCRYSKIEFDINEEDIKVKSSDNKLTESELNDLMLLNLIHCIKNKFDSEELYLYRKIRIHGTLYKLEDIKIYFNNKVKLYETKEKGINYANLITFITLGITILINMIFKNGQKITLIIIEAIMFTTIVAFMTLGTIDKIQNVSLREIRTREAFYELVLNILESEIKNSVE